jgi:hypothetical protein
MHAVLGVVTGVSKRRRRREAGCSLPAWRPAANATHGRLGTSPAVNRGRWIAGHLYRKSLTQLSSATQLRRGAGGRDGRQAEHGASRNVLAGSSKSFQQQPLTAVCISLRAFLLWCFAVLQLPSTVY